MYINSEPHCHRVRFRTTIPHCHRVLIILPSVRQTLRCDLMPAGARRRSSIKYASGATCRDQDIWLIVCVRLCLRCEIRATCRNPHHAEQHDEGPQEVAQRAGWLKYHAAALGAQQCWRSAIFVQAGQHVMSSLNSPKATSDARVLQMHGRPIRCLRSVTSAR